MSTIDNEMSLLNELFQPIHASTLTPKQNSLLHMIKRKEARCLTFWKTLNSNAIPCNADKYKGENIGTNGHRKVSSDYMVFWSMQK